MSSASEGTFDPNDAVLKHASKSRSVTLSADPSREELALDWTLSPTDLQLALKGRGHLNLCRFAVQLCVVRKYGRFLPHYQNVPPAVLGYLCQQLEIPPLLFLSDSRDHTEGSYQRRIAKHLKLLPFDELSAAALETWVQRQTTERMAAPSGKDGLLAEAERFLKAQRIIIPPQATLERTVNTAYRTSEQAVFELLADALPEATKRIIDTLLAPPEGSRVSLFFEFAATPPEAKAANIAAWLRLYDELSQVEVAGLSLTGVSAGLITRLAATTKTYEAWQLRRFDEVKRHALAACFLYEAKTKLLDNLVLMHEQFMNETDRRARNEWEAQHRTLRPKVKKGVQIIRAFAERAVALAQDDTISLRSVVDSVGTELEEAVGICKTFERLQESGRLERLFVKYSNFRRYFPAFAQLPFACEPGSEALSDALDTLRKLDAGELKALPKGADPPFVPGSWRKALLDDSTRRRTWELALAFKLRDALKSGDVYLPESRQHASFWTLCYDEPTWQREQAAAYSALELPTEPEKATTALVEQFAATADASATGIDQNSFAYLKEGRLYTRKDKASPVSEGVDELKQRFERKRSRTRVEALLATIDGRCHYTDELTPLHKTQTEGAERPDYATLLAAIVAHGTNLGVRAMADSTEGVSIDQLLRVSTTCLRPDALEAANKVLVNYHRSLETSSFWGDGTVSSSDGQRFGVQESTLLSSFYPRYFGYYERAVTLYTHVLDQHSVFSTQVISCSEREALFVLDGILGSDLPVQMHHTDTHGYVRPESSVR